MLDPNEHFSGLFLYLLTELEQATQDEVERIYHIILGYFERKFDRKDQIWYVDFSNNICLLNRINDLNFCIRST